MDEPIFATSGDRGSVSHRFVGHDFVKTFMDELAAIRVDSSLLAAWVFNAYGVLANLADCNAQS